MSSNICGNCVNFKPKKGDKFFNCTNARHAGVGYGMQVRADSRSCDAFTPFGTPPNPKPTFAPKSALGPKTKLELRPGPKAQPKLASEPGPKPGPTPESNPVPEPKTKRIPPQEPSAEDPPRPTGLCMWGRVILITALVIIIGLPAWGIYSCANKSASTPLPTPPPMPADAVVNYFDIGENSWAMGSDKMVMVSSAEKVSSYTFPIGETSNAPSGKYFLFVTVTCKNISRDSFFMTGPSYFLLTDSEGHEYKDQTYSSYRINKPYPAANLAPSVTVTGKILWVVPTSASGLEISYLLDPASSPPLVARWMLP